MLKPIRFQNSVFLCILFVLPAFAQQPIPSVIHTIHSMQEIEKYIDSETLVLFDLDHTLIEGKQYGYGHANWFYDQIDEAKAQGLDENTTITKIFPHWLHSQQTTKVKPVEAITPALIKKLQAQGIIVLGLTSRQVPLAAITVNQLNDIDVHFSLPAFAQEKLSVEYQYAAPTLMSHGVIFCSDYNDKGQVLHAYLDKLNMTPAKIVVIDDSLKHLHSVTKAYSKEATVIGLHYPTVAEYKKQHWDPHFARQAYYGAYLNNTQLSPIFIERKKITKKQQQLIAANEAIKEQYEFDVLGKKFTGLPGVFSPKVFGGNGGFAKDIPVKKGMTILEVGTASGYFPIIAALNGAKKVVAVDISPKAVENAKLNAKQFGLTNVVEVRLSDIFSAIKKKEKFDIIYWDIPFNHTDKSELSELEKSVYDPNHLLLTRFLKEAPSYLKTNGIIYLGYSTTHGNIDYLYALAKHHGWMMQTMRQSGSEQTIQTVLYALSKTD